MYIRKTGSTLNPKFNERFACYVGEVVGKSCAGKNFLDIILRYV